MKTSLLVASLAMALAAMPALAQTSSGTTGANGAADSSNAAGNAPSATGADAVDTRFIHHAARDGKAEVDLAKLAQQKAASPEVKSVAQRLAEDHTKANQQLMQIAEQKGVQPPKGIGKKNNKLRARLEKLDGAAFDRAYLQEQVKDHQQDIQYFQREAGTLRDPQLQAFAQQNLPVLQAHLQLLQQAESQAAGSGSSESPASTGGSATPSR